MARRIDYEKASRRVSRADPRPVTDKQRAYLDELRKRRGMEPIPDDAYYGMSRVTASNMIDALKSKPPRSGGKYRTYFVSPDEARQVAHTPYSPASQSRTPSRTATLRSIESSRQVDLT